MTIEPGELRPPVSKTMTANEFKRWYWPVTELKEFCVLLGIPSSGRKSELRERVIASLGDDAILVEHRPKKPSTGSFDWSKETLSDDTIITETITFGKNVRAYFKAKIGKRFVCHSDFMDWVKANPGETFHGAAVAWHALESRKDDPKFRREIAECNNYLNYLRDLRDANPELTHTDAQRCWDAKKMRPAKDGIVAYEPSDLKFLV